MAATIDLNLPVLDTRSKEYRNYVNELHMNAPYNTPEKAAIYREIWERYHKIKLVY
jgi:hypothetical protein